VCASPHLSLPPGLDAGVSTDGRGEEMKCSSLMIADGKGGTIMKDMPKWEDRNGVKDVVEGGKTGMRICKECREIIV